MPTVLITGGTGMIGTRLTELLIGRGYQVTILTRDAGMAGSKLPGVRYADWDPGSGRIDLKAIATTDHIIHLSVACVADKRWTVKRKQEIVNSRTDTSAVLVKALSGMPNHVQSVVSASAIGWYGPDTTESLANGFTENAPADKSFLGSTCRRWEESIRPVEQLGKRLVILRTGIVLAKKGGALEEFKKPLKAGVAVILGDGRQVISWIHLDDLCRMYIQAMEDQDLRGVYNAVAPDPVSNEQFTRELARLLRGKWFVPVHVPSFVLKVMLGEMSIEVLKSATVSSEKIRQAGFTFQYPILTQSLESLL
ncbi:MAG: hypothetical protein JWQ78_80 [Sediminibacterium sp.]|nr:hypothetical protein [Sediminibacterium sp.]